MLQVAEIYVHFTKMLKKQRNNYCSHNKIIYCMKSKCGNGSPPKKHRKQKVLHNTNQNSNFQKYKI